VHLISPTCIAHTLITVPLIITQTIF
jgi:hypothetical protein